MPHVSTSVPGGEQRSADLARRLASVVDAAQGGGEGFFGAVMRTRTLGAHVLFGLGAFGFVAGAIDPLEGPVVILAGSALLLGAEVVRGLERRRPRFWTTVLVLIATGVAMMAALSSVGGIGGKSGRAWWWGLLLLPYLAGWRLGIRGLPAGFIRFLRRRAASRGN
ncbi:MAG: hypothetical protein ACKPB0_04895 [Opitutaceae bacterium]